MNIAVSQASVVSKAQYARLKNVSAARVSQWISEGKIEPDALIGAGRHAKIDPRKADAYLRKNLNIDQVHGNGLSTRQVAVVAEPLAQTEADPPLAPSAPVVAADPIEEKIKRERLEGLQRENRKRAEDEAARAGLYTRTEITVEQMGRIASTTLTVIEGGLSEIASVLASKFQIPQRDALHVLRSEFRTIRTRAVGVFKQQATETPATIEEEIATIASEPDGDHPSESGTAGD